MAHLSAARTRESAVSAQCESLICACAVATSVRAKKALPALLEAALYALALELELSKYCACAEGDARAGEKSVREPSPPATRRASVRVRVSARMPWEHAVMRISSSSVRTRHTRKSPLCVPATQRSPSLVNATLVKLRTLPPIWNYY